MYIVCDLETEYRTRDSRRTGGIGRSSCDIWTCRINLNNCI